METDSIRFFFFGCWNDGGCRDNENLRNVISNINSNKHLYEFGVILGDNVYNKKGSTFHDVSVLKDGIDCIGSLNLPLYIALGNHDVTQCDIINEQAKKSDYWNFESNFYAVELGKNNLKLKLIIIDTNLLADDKIYNSLTNFKDEPCVLPSNIYNNKTEMLQFLENQLKDYEKYDWIIVAGHDPIASFKVKSKTKGPLAKPHIDILMNSMGRIPNLVYICADTHNFQYNTITSTDGIYQVDEVISGTGGAKPDTILPEFRNNENSIQNLYNIKMHDTHEPYGYCDMTVHKDNIIFIYNKNVPTLQQHLYTIQNKKQLQKGGMAKNIHYFKKYLKYKTKYEELKTTMNQ
ncbi:putative tartrate-resistant acid phosphatase type 5 [Tupanvirus deep ocean]|uniref:Tartrate-resistant acid phosphatase type 5 n=2 Tax=Tupanvirus TaxID=2094720 RepID=A0AC62A8Y8_9VIRU|nr:putative tartrate-resistant acid phosphatase type 5 [Tupanvirus deep ocean]QKU34108.1 putative tartrate-resistant acid phosphatase type 5 [Tupanvirus deep ocean]